MICKMFLKVKYFAADKGKIFDLQSFYRSTNDPFLRVCVTSRNLIKNDFQMIF